MSRGPTHVTKTLSGISRSIAKSSGIKAKISIQKIYSCWEDIIGKDFADKCIPVHISWSKYQTSKKPSMMASMPKLTKTAATTDKDAADQISGDTAKKQANKKTATTATLHIAASSAIATRLMYQEHLILERLSRILGYESVTAISIKHESGLENKSFGHALPRKLNKSELEYLDKSLSDIEDKFLKEQLQRLGEKILLDKNR